MCAYLSVLGYLFAQYPAGYLLQRLPVGKFIGGTAIIWGILMITTPACTNFAGIAANRFLLGVVEAVVNPGFVLIMVSLGHIPPFFFLRKKREAVIRVAEGEELFL